jgi:hypothetical protein
MSTEANNVDIERLDAQMTELLEYVYPSPNRELNIALSLALRNTPAES